MKSNYIHVHCQTIAILHRFMVVPLLFLGLTSIVVAQSVFTQGEGLFLHNKPLEAIPLLEAAVAESPSHVTASLYLGIAYQQTERLDEAIAVFRKILPQAGEQKALIAYNLGNAYFAKGAASFALQYYTQAIEADSNYASAYLNRANSQVRTGALQEAVTDYEQYLSLEPSSPKRSRIEQIISLIRGEMAAEERRQEVAAEAARAEAERRQRLLEEVSASLQEAAEETKGVQAGSEGIMLYDGEFELE